MEAEKTLLNEIRLLHIAMHRAMQTICAVSTDIPPVAGMVLHFIHDRGGRAAQKEVERQFHLRRSTASEVLRRLEQEGYVTREASETDGRVKYIVLSAKAQAEQGKLRERFSAFETYVKSALTDGEQATFFGLCEKLRAHADAIDPCKSDGVKEKEKRI